MNEHRIIIFTDGASSGNPGPGGWGAVIVIPEEIAEIIERGGFEKHTTNNRMELTAAAEALSFIKGYDFKHDAPEEIIIYTDSRYLINGVTKWIRGWEKNGWQTSAKKDVINRDLWEKLSELVTHFHGRFKIHWEYVKGHASVAGNERADEIATSRGEADLYHGPAAQYPRSIQISISELARLTKNDSSSEHSDKKSRSRSPAHSYVSLIDGKIMIDKKWSECEARVKGRSGVKFKKALSADDEKRIIEEWTS